MPRSTKNQAPPPGQPGTTEAVPAQNETIDAAALNVASAAENQVAPAPSDSPEATATSPVRNDDFGTPDISEPTTDADPSLADPGTAEPTSPQDETPEPEATKDVAGAESQASVASSSTPEENLPLTNDGYAKQPSVPEDGGWFVPFVPPAPKLRATKPAPEPQPSTIPALIDKFLRDAGIPCTPVDTLPNAASQTPAAADRGSDPEMAPPTEVLIEPEVPQPPPRKATPAELIRWIKIVLLSKTHLSPTDAELAAYWVISTWFFDALEVFPCLVVTGPAQDGIRVLHALKDLCCWPAMLAGLRRNDLGLLYRYRTHLISEPNLDKRTANLLSSLTDRKFVTLSSGGFNSWAKPIAIYAGEEPETHKIMNSIHIHLVPTNAEPAGSTQLVGEMRQGLSKHLEQYRETNRFAVNYWTWTPLGLSSEMATVAEHLGCCIVDAPELRCRLTGLLKIRDRQRLADLLNTTEAVVLEATRNLSRGGRDAYAREIATEANRLLEARGEAARLSAEKVGHALKKLGLHTRELSQTGNGLRFEKATVARIYELATMYNMEDVSAEAENLPTQQPAENKTVE